MLNRIFYLCFILLFMAVLPVMIIIELGFILSVTMDDPHKIIESGPKETLQLFWQDGPMEDYCHVIWSFAKKCFGSRK